MVVPLAVQMSKLVRSLRRGTSLQGYTQRSGDVSTSNCRLLDVSVMNRRPAIVEQICAAGGVCCVSIPADGRSWVAYTSALLPRSGDGTSRGCVRCHLGRGYAACSAIPGAGAGYLVLEQGSLELMGGSLKLVRRRSCWVLSAATWRERSSISCRSVVFLGGGPTLTNVGWGATSEMPSAQRGAASKPHSS
jgi:hypothetical protein